MQIIYFEGSALSSNTFVGLVVLAVVALAYYRAYRGISTRKRLPLPPGPPSEFLLGHYRVVPEDAAFKAYAAWSKQYRMCDSIPLIITVNTTWTDKIMPSEDNDVLFFETFGTKWIVLNSLESAVELLDKRGSNYADRPRFVMFEEYVSPRASMQKNTSDQTDIEWGGRQP